MDAQSCILTRRSVRKFTDEPVPHELLEKVVSLAAYAPSWKNTQISRYIAIEDPAVRKEIASMCSSSSSVGASPLVPQTISASVPCSI